MRVCVPILVILIIALGDTTGVLRQASAENGVGQHELAKLADSVRYSGQLELLEVSPEGSSIALAWFGENTGGEKTRQLQLVDTSTFQSVMAPSPIGSKNRTGSLSFSPDGNLLAVGIDYGAQIWDAARHRRSSTLPEGHLVWQGQFHPRRAELISNGGQRLIERWQPGNPVPIGQIETPYDRVVRLRFCQNGTRLLVVGNRGGKQSLAIHRFPGFELDETLLSDLPLRSITEIRLSPDQTRFVALRPHGRLDLGDMTTMTLKGSVNCGGHVHQYRFVGNDHLMATVGTSQLVWINLDEKSVTIIARPQLATPQFLVLDSPKRLVGTVAETESITRLCVWDLVPLLPNAVDHEMSPSAHHARGVKMCLEDKDWRQGLVHLRRSPYSSIAKLAAEDLDAGVDPLARISVAQQWVTFSRQAENSDFRQLARSAAEKNLRQAIGTSKGLTRLRAEAALKELRIDASAENAN
ncbi:WD40 repeat domain-containing protein [Roseiconus lacunae]|uniref:WD40 repeat domain-containing protein n=1 Tax=Roseiconus lacunae TaxID=2605694 RepID=A0ABT7PSD5_9BACT|nr:WD40 repeat domain-containing protein [Roseiconus lacunae]MDM4019021.1 WD40 repeat domain-containing protein [Roseiconus lacunae]